VTTGTIAKYKKASATRGLWSWLFGHGWSGAGGATANSGRKVGFQKSDGLRLGADRLSRV
jgi:hypothetical protein